MSSTNKLVVISSKGEAERQIKVMDDKIKVVCLSLEAEFFLKKKFKSYDNPLYVINGINAKQSLKKFYLYNFRLSNSWFRRAFQIYLRDKLGYWLTELNRSLDFAMKGIEKFRPKEIVIGNVIDHKGASVIDGNLTYLAFQLIAKYKKIPLRIIKSKRELPSFKNAVGKIIRFNRLLFQKTDLSGNCDLLVLAPPGKLVHMKELVGEFSRNNVSARYITYHLTFDFKKRLDNFLPSYMEKEKLWNRRLRGTVLQLDKIEHLKKYHHPRYKNIKEISYCINERIKKVIKEEMGDVIMDLELASRILKYLKPKILITLTDPDTKCLPYINVAKSLGIKTISIQHGASLDNIAQFLPQSDFYIVWSKLVKNWYIKNKYANTGEILKLEKILVGQSPFHRSIKYSRKRIKGKIKILVLTTQHYFEREITLYFFKILFSLLEKLSSKVEVKIRTHPSQKKMDFLALIKNSKIKISLDKRANLENSIVENDLVIFENTTAGLDAMLAGKPTIFFNPYTGGDFFGLEAQKASISILSEEDIERKLTPFIVNKKAWNKYAAGGQKFAREYLGLIHNENQIASTVKKLLKSSKNKFV